MGPNMSSSSGLKLAARAFLFYVASLALVGGLLFSTAGSLRFWNAWLFLGALFIPMLAVLVYLLLKAPDLLEKRMKTREKEKPQRLYLLLSLVTFLISFSIPGFDYRYGWSSVPLWVVILSTFAMLTGYFSFFVVMVQNRYASRVVEIQEGQKLIDKGMYSVVRHPMYGSATLLYVSAMLVLGSYFAIIPVLSIPMLLVIRIRNEESVLREGLPGYSDYMNRVRYRMIPFVW